MDIKTALTATAVYWLTFTYGVLGTRTLFDAAWLIAICSVPSSIVAHANSLPMAVLFGYERSNIVIDLALLLVCGTIQYALAGYFLGTLIKWFRHE